ncbi:hypothetical protein [Devosia sp. FJ2-5-3]|uniref:hypothetical protein n=1 Tax=Devosia sp. FJ2-5-3 TaxID=2976680 RepID=UPI0023D8BB99|nr:hypothetical protein [Devosia sp. FJ2-5-3]WEJ56752.1 hypothetical protein N0P34_10995 [Devosia sp. FJ2-5-3]
MTRPIRTLEDFRDTDRAIHAYCSHYWVCSHDAQLRLEILAVHLGWAFDFYSGRDYLAGRLRCSTCGWYHPTFALGHAGKRPEFSGSHGAGVVVLATEELVAMQRAREVNIAGEMPWVGVRKGGRKFGR